MWELICHHTYKLGGLPVDLSDHNQHGQARSTEFLPDGIDPGSGALRFESQSIVNIPVNPVWQTLGGLQIEVVARINSPTSPQPLVLIRGDRSFGLQVHNHDVLACSYPTSQPTSPGSSTEQVNSISDAIVDLPYRVPVDEWVTFGFLHNGLDMMDLYVNGYLIARKTGLLSGVPGVSGAGIHIGMVVEQDFPISLDIDEVKVWRLDPRRVDKQFVSRQPVDAATAGCWEQFFGSMQEILAKNPECEDTLRLNLPAAVDQLRREIRSRGDAAAAHLDEVSYEYARLWKAGQLDSPEMTALIQDWCSWMQAQGISASFEPWLWEMISSCVGEAIEYSDLYYCDPQILALIELIPIACR